MAISFHSWLCRLPNKKTQKDEPKQSCTFTFLEIVYFFENSFSTDTVGSINIAPEGDHDIYVFVLQFGKYIAAEPTPITISH